MKLKDAYQQVVAVMRDPEFSRRLIQILEKERRVKQAAVNRNHEMRNISDLPAFELLRVDKEIIDENRALYSTFEDYIIKKLPQPPVITADDLQEVALAQLGGMADKSKDAQLMRFIYCVLLRIDNSANSHLVIELGEWTRAGFESEDDLSADYDGPLWDGLDEAIELTNGFYLDVTIQD